MKSITYKDREGPLAARTLFSVRPKTKKSLRKSLIPRATTLRVLAEGLRVAKVNNLLNSN